MTRYGILLSDELEAAYKTVSDNLDISMEQTLTGALQLFMERMTLEPYPSLANDVKLRHMAESLGDTPSGKDIKWEDREKI